MTHARQVDQARGTAQQRGYTSKWAAYSKAFLKEHPLCGEQADGLLDPTFSRCCQEDKLVPAECVDHIVAVNQGGSFWDSSNHQALCLACNSRKAIESEGGFGR